MPAPSQRDLLTAALLARGYVADAAARTSKYRVLRPLETVAAGDFHRLALPLVLAAGPHRLLLGPSGALRMTRRTVADSFPLSDARRETLLVEGRAILYVFG